jgi:SAM-dependent methyltransferase
MMTLEEQILTRKLACPVTRQALHFGADGKSLVTSDGKSKYPLRNGRVPILLQNPETVQAYAQSSERMNKEYDARALRSFQNRLRAGLISDYRSRKSRDAFSRVFDHQPAEALCLSVGGGPRRPHPILVNLIIAPFPNVDIVADAHFLPYCNDTTQAIFCEAVLEHLADPGSAVREMNRILVPGGLVHAVTPFLQPYHGYPHHYQNFTLQGHSRLFEVNGFRVVEAGTCVGPVYTMASLMSTFLHEYVPGGRWLAKIWTFCSLAIRPVDLLIHLKKNSHILASTTYLVAEKSR